MTLTLLGQVPVFGQLRISFELKLKVLQLACVLECPNVELRLDRLVALDETLDFVFASVVRRLQMLSKPKCHHRAPFKEVQQALSVVQLNHHFRSSRVPNLLQHRLAASREHF